MIVWESSLNSVPISIVVCFVLCQKESINCSIAVVFGFVAIFIIVVIYGEITKTSSSVATIKFCTLLSYEN